MWRYAMWFIILGLMTMVFLGWCVWYWKQRRDTLDDQEFEKARMEHEERMRKEADDT